MLSQIGALAQIRTDVGRSRVCVVNIFDISPVTAVILSVVLCDFFCNFFTVVINIDFCVNVS